MRHVPVLLAETIDALQLIPGSIVIDGTLGDGGHSAVISQQIGTNGKILGIDTDRESLDRAKKFLQCTPAQILYAHGNFKNIVQIAQEQGIKSVDAIMVDLGWSSPQFADRGRGFSFQNDEPLDMRLGGSDQKSNTAADILAKVSEQELFQWFHLYGDEKYAKEIAHEIVTVRKDTPITHTKVLAALVEKIYAKKNPGYKKRIKIHPATKVFQALRMVVNDELQALENFLQDSLTLLKPGGRLAVISFHSKEDSVVKHFYKKHSDDLHIITKKPITPTQKELQDNPRARSAKLRVAEKK